VVHNLRIVFFETVILSFSSLVQTEASGCNRFKERLDDIHNNPVQKLIAAEPADYLFSSAHDYMRGKQGLVKVTVG
jgi:hypothetical protein